ncbi:MAG: hypothetical protein ACOY3L_16260 [Pseudomonadota bacterium]
MMLHRALLALVTFAMAVAVQGSAFLAAATDEPASGATLLPTQSFWKAPDGEVVAAFAAEPDGGVAIVTFDRAVANYVFYRIDRDGGTLWRRQFGEGYKAEWEADKALLGENLALTGWDIVRLAGDMQGGLLACDAWNALRRIDATGSIVWEEKSAITSFAEGNETYSVGCEQFAILADGSTVIASSPTRDKRLEIHIRRLDPGGNLAWATYVPAGEDAGEVKTIVALPDGNIEILFDPLEPERRTFSGSPRSQLARQWRISPEGVWVPQTEMERRMPPLPYQELFDYWTRMPTQWTPLAQRQLPPGSYWFEVEALYRSGDRLVRAGLGSVGPGCGFSLEEWSIDGARLVRRYELAAPLPRDRNWYGERLRYLGQSGERDILTLHCYNAEPFIVAIGNDRSAQWYRADRLFDAAQATLSTGGERFYLLASPAEILSAEIPRDGTN